MIWLTLDDSGYKIIRADRAPNNAVRGPYPTSEAARIALEREELAAARGLAVVLAVAVAGLLISGGAWVVEMLS